MILPLEELRTIVGRKHKHALIDWLDRNRWQYHLNAAGEPVVSQKYAEAKLAGASAFGNHSEPKFDFGAVR